MREEFECWPVCSWGLGVGKGRALDRQGFPLTTNGEKVVWVANSGWICARLRPGMISVEPVLRQDVAASAGAER